MNKPLFNSRYEKEEFENFAQDGFSELLESFVSSDVFVYNDFIRQILVMSRKSLRSN